MALLLALAAGSLLAAEVEKGASQTPPKRQGGGETGRARDQDGVKGAEKAADKPEKGAKGTLGNKDDRKDTSKSLYGKMGSTGDSPVPVGDPPTGTAERRCE